MQIISFSVFYAKSEDKGYSAIELNDHSPAILGWRSSKNCSYPQDIVLKLDAPTLLNRIQILPHQYLIPEKIEIWYTEEDYCDYEKTKWMILGFISFSNNENKKFQSRELKSIDIPFCLTKFLKLSILNCHKNPYNRFDQVSIIAINLLGTKHIHSSQLDVNQFHDNNYQSPYDDLSFIMYCEKNIAELIRLLDIKKQQAVNVERFEYARKLKGTINQLKSIGEKLGKMCLEKRIAIENENFERAQLKKNQIESIKDQCYQELLIDQLLEKNGLLLENDEFVNDGSQPNIDVTIKTLFSKTTTDSSINTNFHFDSYVYDNKCDNDRVVSPCELKPIKSPNIEYISLPKFRTESIRRRNKSIDNNSKSVYESFDNCTIPMMKHSQTEEYLRSYQKDCNGLELKQKCKLSEKDRRQAALPILVFGNELVEKFYSKYYSDKEEGLSMLRKKLQNFDILNDKEIQDNQTLKTIQNANRLTRASVFLLHRTLRDKVFSVYSLANEIIRFLFTDFIINSKVSQAEIIRSIDKLANELLIKSGDASTRVHHMAIHTILSLADCSIVKDLHLIPVLLTRPINSSVHPRLAQSRMEMVEQLVLNYGIHKEKQSGLSCRVLLDFGLSGLHHPAEAVRKVSERILIKVYQKNPQLVRKQLPPDDDITRRNLLYRNLFNQFQSIDLEKKVDHLQQNIFNGLHIPASVSNGNGGIEYRSFSSTSEDIA